MVKTVTMQKTVYVRRADGHECHIAADDFDAEVHERIEAPAEAVPEAPVEPEAAGDAGDAGGPMVKTQATADELAATAVEQFGPMNAGDAIDLIETIGDVAVLEAITAHEQGGKARKTVLHVCEKRAAELAEATDEE
jgi:hypothetical protein